jgi:hypothetical protein
MVNIKNNKYHIVLFILILITLLVIILHKLIIGAVNRNYIFNCKDKPIDEFCGIQKINLSAPDELKREILNQISKGEGKRIVVPGWKSGRTIITQTIQKNIPKVYDWYKNLETYIGKIIGEKVYTTPDKFPTTCAVLIYEEEGDFINWHYDVNYFNGRFFTLLIPVNITNTCTEYVYYDKDGNKQGLQEELGKAILFEGDKVFHMASPFCNKGEKRVIISVQFSTDPTISWYNNILIRIKDYAYIGL